MREIKFRCWDALNEVMKYYTLKELAGDDKFSCDTEYEAIQSGFNNWIWQEFTGLKDRYGKEIYEGDIVECGKSNDAQLAIICFRQQAFILRYLPHSTKDTDDVYDYMEDYKHFKVIGNTCENPDLLTNPPTIK